MIKITVATVTYNAATTLESTIKSVEAQTFPHIEHLIIDGNSQDETLALVHHYQERNSVAKVPHEITCLSEPDDGLYDAMNKALQAATGMYIVFLNAGDTFPSAGTVAHIAACVERAVHEETPLSQYPAVVYGQTDVVNARGEYLRPRHLQAPAVLTWRSLKRGMLVCHQAFYARTDLARDAAYDLQYRYSADFDWCVRVLKAAAARRLPVVNAQCLVAHFLDGGTTTQNHRASLQERFQIMRHHYGLFTTSLWHVVFFIRNARRRQ